MIKPKPSPGVKSAFDAVKPVDPVAGMYVSSDPVLKRAAQRSIYADLFEKLNPGQCIVCNSEDVGRVSHALSKWLQKTGQSDKYRMKATMRYTDGKGRVWMLPKDAIENVERGQA